mmetsp:Transcript_12751/g.21201  ORF Transcript_12751/g.21201 Transcript_12751/m.21201 type:complete len:256 (+) Transcript_12751:111-878(+)
MKIEDCEVVVDIDVNSLRELFPLEWQENQSLVEAIMYCSSKLKSTQEDSIASVRKYLKWRRSTFGNLRSHDLSAPENEKLVNQLKSGFMSMSETRLQDGRGVIYLSMKHHDATVYNTADTIKALHFFIMSAIFQDPTLNEHGFVLVNNMHNVCMRNLDFRFPAEIASAVSNSIPIRLKSIIIMHPPTIFRYLIPVIKGLLSSSPLLSRVHVVTQQNQLSTLLNTESALLPQSIGGHVGIDVNQRVQRMISEGWTV